MSQRKSSVKFKKFEDEPISFEKKYGSPVKLKKFMAESKEAMLLYESPVKLKKFEAEPKEAMLLYGSPAKKRLDSYHVEISMFVKNVCMNRDESHGYEHMKHVMFQSGDICREIFGCINNSNEHIYKLIFTVAWLHDVPDHKYDTNGELLKKVITFVSKYFNDEDTKLIINIIDRISYSKENKNGTLNWYQVLGSMGCLIRDIVSDADKLEALGKSGLRRCIAYTMGSYQNKYNKKMPYEEMVNDVKQHAKEKLLRLKTEYIRTKPGKRIAEFLHNEFVDAINKL